MGEIRFADLKMIIEKTSCSCPDYDDIWRYVHGWKNEDIKFIGEHIPKCDKCSKEVKRLLELDKKLGIN